MPSPVVKPSCGTFTSAVKPAGVSAYDVSGATVNAGGNDKMITTSHTRQAHPSDRATGSFRSTNRGFCPNCRSSTSSSTALHTTSATSTTDAETYQRPCNHTLDRESARSLGLTPHRSRLWTGSPGTPHNVIVLKIGLIPDIARNRSDAVIGAATNAGIDQDRRAEYRERELSRHTRRRHHIEHRHQKVPVGRRCSPRPSPLRPPQRRYLADNRRRRLSATADECIARSHADRRRFPAGTRS